MKPLKTALLLLAVTFAGSLLSAQENDRRVVLNSVSVAADGRFEAAPDTAVLQFTIGAQADTSEAAYDRAARAADRLRQVLRANGLDPKTAEIGFYSLQPMYDYRTAKRKIVGYRVTASTSTRLRDFAKVGPLLTALSGIEDTENQSVGYLLENMEAAKQKAIEDAMNKAKASAQTVARAGGRTLGELAYAGVDTFEQQPPVPMMGKVMAMRAEAAPAAPTEEFTPQKITVTAHVNALFNLK